MSLQPGTPIGKYLVRRKLAEGGMAEIYLAASQGPEGFEKEVVIKRIRSFLATDPGFVQMFIAEARVASRLNHANLVQIFDFEKHEDTYYLAMEYVRGHSLWDIRRRAKEQMRPMSPTLAAFVCTEVARGLSYAHRVTDRGQPLKLVHRDVTPHNVLISFDGAVKLTDFGIAKAAGQRMTSPGMLKGKFAYMSPEQARGDEVDGRSDLFSLGIVLWELVTGGRLFEGDSDVSVLKAVQQSVIPPPARLNPDVSQALDAIVMKALSRNLAERYQTAQELERALAQHVLTVAESVDDTDLPAYLAALFPEDAAGPGTTHPGQASAGGAAVPRASPQDPTRADRVDSPEPRPVLSPDEDPDGLTYISDRNAAGKGSGLQAAQTPEVALAADATVAPGLGASAGDAVIPAKTVGDGAAQGGPKPRRGVLRVALGAALGAAVFAAGAAVVIGLAAAPRPADSSAGQATTPMAATTPAGHSEAGSPLAPGATGGAMPATSGDLAPISRPAEPSPSELPAAEPPGIASAPGDGVHSKTGPAPVGRGPSTPAGSSGTLVVRATPWATLFVDGKPYGEIDGSRRRIPLVAGPHTVLFQHPSRTRSFAITVEAGQELQRDFSATR